MNSTYLVDAILSGYDKPYHFGFFVETTNRISTASDLRLLGDAIRNVTKKNINPATLTMLVGSDDHGPVEIVSCEPVFIPNGMTF